MSVTDTLTTQFLQQFEQLSQQVPLGWASFLGALIEEIIAPIPSPIVMTTLGSLTAAKGEIMLTLLWLAVIGALGKTIGAYLFYWLADKGEDVIVGKFGKFLGVSHEDIERIGKKFNNDWRDDLLVFLARAIPIMPSPPVSIVCGLIKLNLRTFLWGSFAGNFVRNLMFLGLGYYGLSSYENLLKGLDSAESIVQLLIVAALAVAIVVIYVQRRKFGRQS